MNQAIVVRDLSKIYRLPSLRFWRAGRTVQALQGVSFSCPSGAVTCLLGPNGAGKTTILKILAGLVLPDSGELTVLGVGLTADPCCVQRRLGIVTPNDRSFYWRLTGRQNLDFFAALYGLKGRQRRRRIAEILSELTLESEADKPYRLYSSGMKQKLLLARALLGRPEILLLDEPTVHLDPIARTGLHRLVREHLVGRLGATVLYCTHDLAEADELAAHLVLLRAGKVAAEGSLDRLRTMVEPRKRFIMEFDRLPAQGWETGISVEAVEQRDGRVEVWMPDPAAIPDIVKASIANGGRLLRCSVHDESLSDIFTRMAGGAPA